MQNSSHHFAFRSWRTSTKTLCSAITNCNTRIPAKGNRIGQRLRFQIQIVSKPATFSRTLPYATRLYHFRWRKKKADSFLIPPQYFKISDYSIVESNSLEKVAEKPIEKAEIKSEVAAVVEKVVETISEKLPTSNQDLQPKVSAFSLAGLKAKKELHEANKLSVKDDIYLPSEAFTETEMLIFWNKYAQRLADKGHKIMESLLQLNRPKLDGNIIVHELPNEGSKIDFENEKHELLQFLRSHLKNHDLTIRVDVNEVVLQKFAFTDEDKYERLLKINPNLELLKKTFDLIF